MNKNNMVKHHASILRVWASLLGGLSCGRCGGQLTSHSYNPMPSSNLQVGHYGLLDGMKEVDAPNTLKVGTLPTHGNHGWYRCSKY